MFFIEVLTMWISREGKDATWGKLVATLKAESFIQSAEEVQKLSETATNLGVPAGVWSINCFWINSFSARKAFLLEIEPTSSILQLRKSVLKLIGQGRVSTLEKEQLSSQIFLMTEDSYFLTEKEDSLQIQQISFGQLPRLLVFSLRCGSLAIQLQKLPCEEYKGISKIIIDLARDNMSSLRTKVAETQNIPIEDLCLQIHSIPLEHTDEPIFSTIRVPYPTLMFFASPKKAAIAVNCRTLTGKMFIVNIYSPFDTVEIIKRRITQIKGIPVDQQRLIYAGKQLEDDKLWSEYGIQNGDILHLVLRLRGAGPSEWDVFYGIPGQQFADIADERNLLQKPSQNSSAPTWKQVYNGLNVEGVCGNSTCVAFESRVISRLGFTDFRLKDDKEMVKCPMCTKSLKCLLTCGFTSTFWRYFGHVNRERENQELVFSDWRFAGADSYLTYYVSIGDGIPQGMESWDFLVIQTRAPVELGDGIQSRHPTHCAICFKEIDFYSTDKVRLPACGHIYHKECLEWNSFSCNLCKINDK